MTDSVYVIRVTKEVKQKFKKLQVKYGVNSDNAVAEILLVKSGE